MDLLLQTTPLVGALSIEKGKGFELLIKNLKFNFSYNFYKSIYVSIYDYMILKFFALIIRNVPLLAVSRSVPYELERLGVKANIKVVEPGNGVDPCPYVGSEKFYDLVFFARVVPKKGIFDYLKVVASLEKRGEKIKALVVGFADDRMSAEIRRRVAELGISRHVEFRFNVPRQEALRLIASSKVMVYPTRFDSFSLTVLEALSCGTPVVAYAIPAIRFNYETDAVVKTKPLDLDELIYKTMWVLKEELWRDLGIEGVKFSEKYTWENVAKSEWRLLKEIAENNTT